MITDPNTVRVVVSNRLINLPITFMLRYTKVSDEATILLPEFVNTKNNINNSLQIKYEPI